MATPQPNQIQQYYPVGGELKYLFTKTMTQDDMFSSFWRFNQNPCSMKLASEDCLIGQSRIFDWKRLLGLKFL
ncbi:hypothetical protein Peur_049355 [Populus x canadensis]